MSVLRCDEPGWIRCGGQDRRGLWYRGPTDGVVELCSGREGDDGYVKITRDVPLDGRALADLEGVLSDAAFALDVERGDEERNPLRTAVLRAEARLHEALQIARQPGVRAEDLGVMMALQNAVDALDVALRGG